MSIQTCHIGMSSSTADPISPTVSFQVLGLPAPQGSKTAIMIGDRPQVIEGRRGSGRARHRAWRHAVADAAMRHAGTGPPLDGPLRLEILFYLPMPTSRPKRIRATGRAWHTTRPDLSKLIRATEDALTDAGLIRDDARICQLDVTKAEVVGWTGAQIAIGPAVGTP